MKSLGLALAWLWTICALHAESKSPLVSCVEVLTIHVCDTNTHERVYRMLVDDLGLPTDYYPLIYAQRRYAAVFAGNLYIEPCGPYAGNRYPERDFQALFYGLNCDSPVAPEAIAARLKAATLSFEWLGTNAFNLHDSRIAEGSYWSINFPHTTQREAAKEARLKKELLENGKSRLGFMSVREIWLGGAAPGDLNLWQEVLGPGKSGNADWRLNKQQTIRWVDSPVRGVRGIVCQVSSLDQAEKYLKRTGYYGSKNGPRIELNRAKTYGLVISVEE